jgi:hypothetical protein
MIEAIREAVDIERSASPFPDSVSILLTFLRVPWDWNIRPSSVAWTTDRAPEGVQCFASCFQEARHV